jgi:hypothetical protein
VIVGETVPGQNARTPDSGVERPPTAAIKHDRHGQCWSGGAELAGRAGQVGVGTMTPVTTGLLNEGCRNLTWNQMTRPRSGER